MYKSILIFWVGVLMMNTTMSQSVDRPALLVFYETKGFYHSSIPAGVKALLQLGQQHGFRVDTAAQSEGFFTPEKLKTYQAVLFLNTTGDVFTNAEKNAFQTYILQGGGFAGVHAATDTEFKWPWFNQLVGAYFKNHPQQQDAVMQIRNQQHLATRELPATWRKWDEWYNFKDIQPGIQVLINLDESSYKGGENGAEHPISWYHNVGKGRSFYTGLGHTDASYQDALFLKHLLGGIQYAMGQ